MGRERVRAGSGGEFVATQPDCGVWEHNHPLRNELMHAGTRTNTHEHTRTHAHAGTVGICADRAAQTLPWLGFPSRPFASKLAAAGTAPECFSLVSIHVPPTAPVRHDPPPQLAISEQICSPSDQSDFPPRVLFLLRG